MVTLDEVLGKSVIGSLGTYIGEVDDIDMELNTWQITHLQVKLSNQAAKAIGVKKAFKSCILRVPTSLINEVGITIKYPLKI